MTNMILEQYLRSEQCSADDLIFLVGELRAVEKIREQWLSQHPLTNIVKLICKITASDTTKVFLCNLTTSIHETGQTDWSREINESFNALIKKIIEAEERLQISITPSESSLFRIDREYDLSNAKAPQVTDYFRQLLEKITQNKLSSLLSTINNKYSLFDCKRPIDFYKKSPEKVALEHLYENVIERIGIDFSVYRFPFEAEVLDPRFVVIRPRKSNEKHKHAHETIFFILNGYGMVLVDDKKIEVKEGDIVFIPRWCVHQSQNLSDEEMNILAITDFGITGKAFIGNYLKTARLKKNL